MLKYAILRGREGKLEVTTCPAGCEKAMMRKYSGYQVEYISEDEFFRYRDALDAGYQHARKIKQEET